MRLFRPPFSEGTTTVRIDWNLKVMRSTPDPIKLFDALFFGSLAFLQYIIQYQTIMASSSHPSMLCQREILLFASNAFPFQSIFWYSRSLHFFPLPTFLVPSTLR